jgi:hypothetical protein
MSTTQIPAPIVVNAAKAPETPRLKVWRYELEGKPAKDQGIVIDMPDGAQVLGVHRGSFHPVIFALVNPAKAMRRRCFYPVKTNFPIPTPEEFAAGMEVAASRLSFVGSYMQYGETWHLFEVIEIAAERERSED